MVSQYRFMTAIGSLLAIAVFLVPLECKTPLWSIRTIYLHNLTVMTFMVPRPEDVMLGRFLHSFIK